MARAPRATPDLLLTFQWRGLCCVVSLLSLSLCLRRSLPLSVAQTTRPPRSAGQAGALTNIKYQGTFVEGGWGLTIAAIPHPSAPL